MHDLSLTQIWRINHEEQACHPLLDDIDGDGSPETVVVTKENKLKVYDVRGKPIAMSRLPKSRKTKSHFVDVADFPAHVPSLCVCTPSSCTDGEKRIVAVFPDGRIAMYTPSAKRIWLCNLPSSRVSTPLPVGQEEAEQIVVASGDTIFSFDSDGRERWRKTLQGQISPHLSIGYHSRKARIYGGTERNTLFCLDSGGELLWETSTDGVITAAPLVFQGGESATGEQSATADGVFVPTTERVLSVLSSSGEPITSCPLPGPCLDSMLTLAGEDEKKVLIGVSAQSAPVVSFSGGALHTLTTHGFGVRTGLTRFDFDSASYLAYGGMDRSLLIFDLDSLSPHPTRFKKYTMGGPITHKPRVFSQDTAFHALVVENTDTLVMLRGEPSP